MLKEHTFHASGFGLIFNKLLKTFHQLLSQGPYMGISIFFSEEDNMP